MPMYSFQCKECGKRFEELVSYSGRDQVRCPDCGGSTEVLVSGFAVGSGGSSSCSSTPPRSGFS